MEKSSIKRMSWRPLDPKPQFKDTGHDNMRNIGHVARLALTQTLPHPSCIASFETDTYLGI
jgi:hypothetical protein